MLIYGSPIVQKQTNRIPNLGSPYSQTTKSHQFSWWGIATVFSFVAEIGLALVPGLQSMAAIIPIGLAGASARLGIAFGEGQVNVLTEAIDFGSVPLPGITEAFGNYKFSKTISGTLGQEFLAGLANENQRTIQSYMLEVEGEKNQTFASFSQKRKLDAETRMNAMDKLMDEKYARIDEIQLQMADIFEKQRDKYIRRIRRSGTSEMKRAYRKIIETGTSKGDLPSEKWNGAKWSEDGSHLIQSNPNSTKRMREFLPYARVKRSNYIHNLRNTLEPDQITGKNLLRDLADDFFLGTPEQRMTRTEWNNRRQLARILTPKNRRTLQQDDPFNRDINRRAQATSIPELTHLGSWNVEDAIYYIRAGYEESYKANAIDMLSKLNNTKLTQSEGEVLSQQDYIDAFIQELLRNKSYTSDNFKNSINRINKTRRSENYMNQRKLNERVQRVQASLNKNQDAINRSIDQMNARYTARTNRAIEKISDRYGRKLEPLQHEQAVVSKLAKSLAEIQPSIKISKGYLVQFVRKDLDELSQTTSKRITDFIYASTRGKKNIIAKHTYETVFKNVIKQIKDDESRAVCVGLFDSLGNLPPRDLKKLFESTTEFLAQTNRLTESELSEFNRGYEAGVHFYNRKYNIGYQIMRKTSNSSKFRYRYIGKYGKIVRPWTLINPLTMARAIPDSLYQTTKNYFDKRLINKTKEEMDKLKGDLLNARRAQETGEKDAVDRTLEKAFVQGGGVLIPRNRYLMGYKIMPLENDVLKGEHLALLVFNKLNTSSNNPMSKNYGGKHDVLCTMTDMDMKKLVEEGVQYYWNFGKPKGWWINRGGRNEDSKWSTILGRDTSFFLGFLPINTLRNTIQAASATQYEAIRWINGKNTKNFGNKFYSTMTRTALNRIGRFGSKFWIGIPLNKFISSTRGEISTYGTRVIGKEIQRYTSLGLALMLHTNSQGNLSFKLPTQQTLMNRLATTSLRSVMRQGMTGYGSPQERSLSIKDLAQSHPGLKYRDYLRMNDGQKGKWQHYRYSRIRDVRSNWRNLGYLRRGVGVAYSRALPGGNRIGKIKV